MKKVLKNLAFVAATVLMFSACSEKKTNEVNNFRIQRGTNVSHWLSQSEERGEARLLHIQEDDFARLDSLGFDFVRLPIDEVQFWDEQGNKLPEAPATTEIDERAKKVHRLYARCPRLSHHYRIPTAFVPRRRPASACRMRLESVLDKPST